MGDYKAYKRLAKQKVKIIRMNSTCQRLGLDASAVRQIENNIVKMQNISPNMISTGAQALKTIMDSSK